jgi:hypothetical protein
VPIVIGVTVRIDRCGLGEDAGPARWSVVATVSIQTVAPETA